MSTAPTFDSVFGKAAPLALPPLKASLDYFVMDHLSDAVLWIEPSGRVTMGNRAAEQILGFRPMELAGKPISQIIPAFQGDAWTQQWTELQSRGRVVLEASLQNIHRRTMPMELVLDFAQFQGRSFACCMARDISLRRETEATLLESELNLAEAEAIAQLGHWSMDAGTGACFLSRSGRQIYGFGSDEPSPSLDQILNRILEEDRSRAFEQFRIALRDGQGFEQEFRASLPGQGLRYLQLVSKPKFDEQGKLTRLFGTVQDITERKRGQEARNRLALAMEQVKEAIAITQTDGTILYVNPSFEHLLGYSQDELMGCDLSILDREGGEGFAQEILPHLGQSSGWNGQISIHTREGQPLKLEGSLSPVHDPQGTATHLILVLRDVTERENIEEQLRQAQKLDALATLAAGLSHDYNNILTAISAASEMLLSQLPHQSPLLHKAEIITQACKRAQALNRRLLAFSKPSTSLASVFSMSLVLREALDLLRATLPNHIHLTEKIREGLMVHGDSDHIHQILMNLGANASHAMKEMGGVLSVNLEMVELDDAAVQALPGLKPGLHARLQISDTGHGIPPDIQSRIFDPFFTTKKASEGTGLGLASVHGLLRGMGGHISVQSEVGKGACFTLLLPCFLETETESLPHIQGAATGQRILLVDDESSLAELEKQSLESYGYQVDGHTDGQTAFEAFSQDPQAYDALVSDLHMPGITGLDLAVAIQRIRPKFPVLFISGSEGEGLESLSSTIEAHHLLPKPFSIKDLISSVQDLLSGQTPKPAQETPLPKPSAPPLARGRKGRILLAEDSPSTQAVIARWLEAAGYNVDLASNGQKAWELFQKYPYQLVLTDIVMPEVDGLELTRRIREKNQQLPVVILSGSEDRDYLKTALHLSVSEYLSKPFEAPALTECVARLMRQSKTQAETQRSLETASEVRSVQKALIARPDKEQAIFTLAESYRDAGGDVFRSLKREDGSVLFVLADVAGHSVTSSYAVAAFLGMLTSFLNAWTDLGSLAAKLNQGVQEGPFSEIPVCALLGHWCPDRGRLHLLNAGMPHGLLFRSVSKCAQNIPLNGTPLGMLDEPIVEEKVLALRMGDRLLFGTDGFFDLKSPEGQKFEEVAPKYWSALQNSPINWALSTIGEAARAHRDGPLCDDLLAIAFEQPRLKDRPGEFVLNIPSQADQIDKAVERLKKLLQDSPLSPSRLFDLVLATREALTNAMIHGNEANPAARIGLSARFLGDGQELELRVVDEGSGFDLRDYQPPEDILSDRGRGLPLISQLARSIHMAGGELVMHFDLKEDDHERHHA